MVIYTLKSLKLLIFGILLLLIGFPHLYQCQKCKQEEVLVYDCTNLSLSDLPHEKLQNAFKLDISYNKITILKNDSFLDKDLMDIGILYLHDNKITTIEVNAFRGMADLDFLNLNNNDIVEIPADVFKYNVKLRFLRLENNTRLRLPQVGFHLPELNVLDLERCGLESIPANFFDNMKDLEILYLRGNKLSYLDAKLIEPLIELEFLDLRENQFTKLQLDILRMPLVFKISYVGNPLKCDCALLRAYSLYKKKAQYEDLSCKNDNDKVKTEVSKLKSQIDCTPTAFTPIPTNASDSEPIPIQPIQENSSAKPVNSDSQDFNTENSRYYLQNETEQASSQSWFVANQSWVITTSVTIIVLVVITIIIFVRRKKMTTYLISNRFKILKDDRDNVSLDEQNDTI